MNLLKNVDGEWDVSKQRVRQDLDTIQRTINSLQASLAALTNQVNTVPPIPAATIAPSGHVTTPLPPLIDPNRKQQFLSTVATNGGLTGDGTVINPLIATGLQTVATGAAGALTGNGTAGNSLSVSVDGVTITINGSNQLVATPSGTSLSSVSSTLSAAQVHNLSTTPVTVIAGIANRVIIPVMAFWWSSVSVGQAISAAPRLVYHGRTTVLATGPANWNQLGGSEQMAPVNSGDGSNAGTTVLENLGIDIKGSNDGGSDGTGVYKYQVFYFTIAPAA